MLMTLVSTASGEATTDAMGRDTDHVSESELVGHLVASAEEIRRFIETRIPRRLRGRLSADDVLQDTWHAAFQGRSSFVRREGTPVIRWLYTIAERQLVDAVRWAQAQKRGDGWRHLGDAGAWRTSMMAIWDNVVAPTRTPSSAASLNEAAELLQLGLAQLPRHYRTVLLLRYGQDLPVPVVARAMDRSDAATHSLLYNARRRLRECLGHAAKYFTDASDSGEQPA